MDIIQKTLLEEVAGLHEVPEGAYNIRANGALDSRQTTANINIVTKQDRPGIDIIIAPGTKRESVHIPVIISQYLLRSSALIPSANGTSCVLPSSAPAAFTRSFIPKNEVAVPMRIGICLIYESILAWTAGFCQIGYWRIYRPIFSFPGKPFTS